MKTERFPMVGLIAIAGRLIGFFVESPKKKSNVEIRNTSATQTFIKKIPKKTSITCVRFKRYSPAEDL